MTFAASHEVVQHHASRGEFASGFYGVYATKSGKWQAKIQYDKQVDHLGTFETKEAAAHAHDDAARSNAERFTRTKRTNFGKDIAKEKVVKVGILISSPARMEQSCPTIRHPL